MHPLTRTILAVLLLALTAPVAAHPTGPHGQCTYGSSLDGNLPAYECRQNDAPFSAVHRIHLPGNPDTSSRGGSASASAPPRTAFDIWHHFASPLRVFSYPDGRVELFHALHDSGLLMLVLNWEVNSKVTDTHPTSGQLVSVEMRDGVLYIRTGYIDQHDGAVKLYEVNLEKDGTSAILRW